MAREITDIVGNIFGRLTVISRAPDRLTSSGKRRVYWNCLCECGNSVEVRTDAFRTTKSCGCLTKEQAKDNVKKAQAVKYKRKKQDLTGMTFGRLTVIREAESTFTPKGRELHRWVCDCRCGNTFNTMHESLRQGKATSCGCILPEYIDSEFKDKTDVFISKARDVHGHIYDYSLTEFITSKDKVKIICRDHGVFEQTPPNHLTGVGCYECWNDSRSHNAESFIAKAQEIHADTYDYSKVVFSGTRELVTITCKIHGEFQQKPSNHLSGRGCVECGKDVRTVGQEEFIRRSREKHGSRYDYTKSLYSDTRIPVEIGCAEHGTFFQKPMIHMSGSKCPKCSGEDRASKQHWDYVERCKLDPKLAASDGILYLLELTDGVEDFLKIGISSSFSRRLSHYKEDGLDYKVLKSVNTTAIKSAILEREVLKTVKEKGFKYIPKAVFAGWTECSTLESKDYLLKVFEEIENSEREKYSRSPVKISGSMSSE